MQETRRSRSKTQLFSSITLTIKVTSTTVFGQQNGCHRPVGHVNHTSCLYHDSFQNAFPLEHSRTVSAIAIVIVKKALIHANPVHTTSLPFPSPPPPPSTVCRTRPIATRTIATRTKHTASRLDHAHARRAVDQPSITHVRGTRCLLRVVLTRRSKLHPTFPHASNISIMIRSSRSLQNSQKRGSHESRCCIDRSEMRIRIRAS